MALWKRQVYEAAEKKNKERLLAECYKKERGVTEVKTKTKTIIPILENSHYQRQPHPFITKNNTLTTRAFIMGKYGMLQCAANYSNGYGSKNCPRCQLVDNENHRINECQEWSEINCASINEKLDFSLIQSDVETSVMSIVQQILSMWDLGNGNNCMRKELT